MLRTPSLILLACAASALSAADVSAQELERVSARLLEEVMPDADRFDEAGGEPLVKRAYRGGELIGYVFLTSDLPPEEQGYSGPIETLVGVTVDGVVTGVHPVSYRESLRYELGDFLSEPGFLAQFAGKLVSDPFGVRQDIDGISGVTISVRAMARTVRDAARRVALAYLPRPEPPPGGLAESDLVGMPWYEMQRRGVAVTMSVRQRRRNPIELSLIHLSSEELGRYLVGNRYDRLMERVENAGGADDLVLYLVGGAGFAPQLRTGWYVEQGGDTLALERDRVVTVGGPAGALGPQGSQFGALMLDDAEVDLTRPLTFAFDRGRPDLGTFRVDWEPSVSQTLVAVAAPTDTAVPTQPPPGTPVAAPPGAAPDADVPADGAVEVGAVAADAVSDDTVPDEAVADRAVADTTVLAGAVADDAVSDESVADPAVAADATLAEAVAADAFDTQAYDDAFDADVSAVAWPRMAVLLLVLTLAGLAFFTKKAAFRWTSLAATAVLLGWVDQGFLSISHVTGLVWVGFSALRSDVTLMVLAVVTVASVVLWGRVFCGFLCPFGALQDFIDRLVPRRFKRELPHRAHRVAWKAKYVILALILGSAVLGFQVSLYQYFEPFGTVFFLSTNVGLWMIAGAFLVASAIVPRFYCRYVCPLGALLAVGSLASLRRIRRVEQCEYCHVCEQKCPTGAITGPKVTFAECVRCNVCEVQLIEKRGVCRHSMEEVRPRLVQLQVRRKHAATLS